MALNELPIGPCSIAATRSRKDAESNNSPLHPPRSSADGMPGRGSLFSPFPARPEDLRRYRLIAMPWAPPSALPVAPPHLAEGGEDCRAGASRRIGSPGSFPPVGPRPGKPSGFQLQRTWQIHRLVPDLRYGLAIHGHPVAKHEFGCQYTAEKGRAGRKFGVGRTAVRNKDSDRLVHDPL